MDDFNTGPDSFTVTLNSLDPQCDFNKNFAQYQCYLLKPLEFTSGTWEVCLKKLIFKPEILNLRLSEADRTIYYRDIGETIKQGSFSLNSASVTGGESLVNLFNSSVPPEIKDRLKASFKGNKFTALVKGIQFSTSSNYLSSLLGLNLNSFYPWEISKEQSEEVAADFAFNPTTDFFQVLTDFTVPEIYGSQNIPIVGLGVCPGKREHIYLYEFENCNYCSVNKSYIPSIVFKLVDRFNNLLQLADPQSPVIAQFHFRRKTVNLF